MRLHSYVIEGVVICLLTTMLIATSGFCKKTSLTLVHCYRIGGAATEAFADIVSDFEVLYPDVRIEVKIENQQVYEDIGLITLLQSPNPPDIYHLIGQWELAVKAREGYARDLTTTVESWFKPRFWKFTWPSLMSEGKIYAVPHRMEISPTIWYNENIFEKYALNAPQKWPEFIEICKKLKENNVTPLYFGNSQLWMFGNFSGWLVAMMAGKEQSGKVFDLEPGMKFANPDFTRAFKLIEELREFVNPGMNGLKPEPSTMAFLQGVGAMHPTGGWFITMAKKSAPEGFRYGSFALPLPSGAKGSQYVQGQTAHFLVNTKCKDFQAAVLFLEFFTRPKNQAKMVETGNMSAVGDAYLVAEEVDPHLKGLVKALLSVGDFVGVPDEYHSVEVADTYYQGAAMVVGGEKSAEEALKWIDKQLEPARRARG